MGQEGVKNTLLYYQQYAQLANLVRPDDILAVARKYLNPNRYVVVFGKGPEAVQPASLVNGAAGYFLQMPGQSRSLVSVTLPIGSLPPGSIGLLTQLLKEGSEVSKQMLSQLSNQGISFITRPASDKLILMMEGPAGQEPLLAQSLLRLMTQPVLEPTLFNDIKLRTIQAQQGWLNNPDDILQTALKQKIYGPNHPFALSTRARMQHLSRVDLTSLLASFQQSLQQTNANKIMMISALPTAQQQQIVNSAILGSSWLRQPFALSATGMPTNLPLPAVSGLKGLVLVPTNASKRAIIQTVWKTPDVRDPDYPAFQLLMEFLRGEDESALLKTMRMDHGLVYGVGMHEGPKLAMGTCYNINVEVDGDQIGPALKDIREVTKAAGQKPIPPDILDRLKRSMLRETRESMQQARSISGVYAPWLTYDAPLPGPEWLEQAIADVTPEDIQRVAKRIFNSPDSMQLVGVTAPEPMLRRWFPNQPLTNPDGMPSPP
jgi:predicted Zn-dependent peptidase